MSDPINTGGPAYPCLGNVAYNSDWVSDDGMSIRDHFAGLVLQGIYASRETFLAMLLDRGSADADDYVAQQAYKAADAMIAHRKKSGAA